MILIGLAVLWVLASLAFAALWARWWRVLSEPDITEDVAALDHVDEWVAAGAPKEWP